MFSEKEISLSMMTSTRSLCAFIPNSPVHNINRCCFWLYFMFPAALIGLLGVLDFLFVNHACHSIITRGASVQLVFGFEVGRVSRDASSVCARIGLHPEFVIAMQHLRRLGMSESAGRCLSVCLPVRYPAHHGADHLHQILSAHH